MDRHSVRQDHLPQPGRQRPAGELELTTPAGSGFTLPLILWLALQLAAIALTDGRVPLWAKYPLAGEALSLHALLATQLIASALLLPVLFKTVRSTIAVAASAWPFAAVAAAMSSTPLQALFFAESYVSLWVIALFEWRQICRSPRPLTMATTTAICLVLSGPLYAYLLNDFSADSSAPSAPPWIQPTPLLSCISLLTGERPLTPALVGLSFLLISPILIFFIFRSTAWRDSAAD